MPTRGYRSKATIIRYFAEVLSAHAPIIGRASNVAISYVERNKPASAKVLENEKIKIGINASPKPQPIQRIVLAQAIIFTPRGKGSSFGIYEICCFFAISIKFS